MLKLSCLLHLKNILNKEDKDNIRSLIFDENTDNTIDFKIIGPNYRRKNLIILVAISCFIFGAVRVLRIRKQPIYQGTFSMLIEDPISKLKKFFGIR